ncbi:MAG: nitrilase-related carbon-nitrogen hydrolase [Streptosporangiaceae bacterium]
MRVALAQTDCVLGDVAANLAQAERCVKDAAARDADLVVFPELSLNGYALGTLSHDSSLRADDDRIAALSGHGPDVVVGFHEDAPLRRYNAAPYLEATGTRHLHRKLYLPNYLAWEERKYASPGQSMRAYDTRHGRIATLICNDAWQSVLPWIAAQDGAEMILIPSTSALGVAPGSLDTISYWDDLLRFIARMQQCWVVFVNRVGDEAGARFWGGSRVIDPLGGVVAQAPRWDPALVVTDVDLRVARHRRREVPLLAEFRLGLVAREIDRLIHEGGDL